MAPTTSKVWKSDSVTFIAFGASRSIDGVPVRRPSYPFSALPTTIPPSEVMSYSRSSLLCGAGRAP